MRPRQQIRKIAKWGGAALTLILVAMWLANAARWGVWISIGTPEQTVSADCWIEYGQIGMFHPRRHLPPLWFGRHNPTIPFEWWFDRRRNPDGSWYAALPVWLPVLISFSTTAVACRFETIARRKPASFCRRCSYDLAGLSSAAPCPECGSAPPTRPRTLAA